ncbi:hypothetical protein B6S12_03155 [Helicobacter valdiviensis]|uniref:Glycosyl transferase n=1 Tax=Helicobacter valdiviensis TaxID=1458358 RepID=A0A2W6MZ84_9HELI|nr:glycosyltransferase [Helicobacter valdiviensis]PZT48648.1 hypothetical protein B6S12_03155 [Helicobacter valdiviensis]
MKIVFIIDVMRQGGGAQKVLSIMLPHLKEQIELIVLKKTENLLEINGIKTHYILDREDKALLPNSFFILDKITQIAKDSTLLVSFMDFITGYYTALSAKILRVPYYCFVRCEPSFVENSFAESKINHELYSLVLQGASKVVCNSKSSLKDVIENFGINKERVELLYNPIDTQNIDMLKNEELGFAKKEGEIVCVSVGRLHAQKNYKTLLKAFKLLQDEDTRFHLYILGEGEQRGEIEDYICKNNLKNITLCGFQKNIYVFLKNADIFIHGSLYEGFPNVVLEAAYLKKPLVLSDIATHTELFSNQEAMFFNPANSLELVGLLKTLSECWVQEEFGTKAFCVIEKYLKTSFFQKLCEIFGTLGKPSYNEP